MRIITLISVLLFILSGCVQKQELIESTQIIEETTNIEEPSSRIEEGSSKTENIEIKWEVPLILQNPELPTGCEITSVTMLLNFYGFNYNKLDMADNYLDKSNNFYYKENRLFGPNPQKVFIGNPRNSKGKGLQCFSGVWVNSLNKALEENNSNYQAKDISGYTLKELENFLNGAPILISATTNMEPATQKEPFFDKDTNKKIITYRKFHCIVLTGYTDEYYYINDPLGKFSKISKNKLEEAYNSTGRQAVIIT